MQAVLLSLTLALATPKGTASETLALAKLCLVEVGWEAANTDDCGAILRALQNQGSSIERAARQAAPRAVGSRASMTGRQHWTQNLTATTAEPEGFPGEWKLFRNRWRAIVREARGLLQSRESESPCQRKNGSVPAEPLAWGMRKPGLTRLDCGYTINTFYGVSF